MSDFTIRADSVDVEQIMRQIRGRIRDKRGVDYTEEQIRELAAAKLERFLDPTGVRSDLLEQFRTRPSLPPGFLYQFEDTTLFDSDKPIVRFFRRVLHPFLKLLFNPNVLSTTLHKQAAFNQYVHAHQPLQFELLHNLVLELTRASIEVKNLKMRLESVQSRLEFNERRARALEAVVQYKPGSATGGAGRDERRDERRNERRRDAHGEGSRGVQGQPRPSQPQSQAQPRSAQQQPQARPPQQARASLPGADAAPGGDEPAVAGTEPQGGVDPITGGESVRTRRRRRRRGRRTGGEQGAGGETGAVPGSGEAASGSEVVAQDERVPRGAGSTGDDESAGPELGHGYDPGPTYEQGSNQVPGSTHASGSTDASGPSSAAESIPPSDSTPAAGSVPVSDSIGWPEPVQALQHRDARGTWGTASAGQATNVEGGDLEAANSGESAELKPRPAYSPVPTRANADGTWGTAPAVPTAADDDDAPPAAPATTDDEPQ